jgi:hypothetical protein
MKTFFCQCGNRLHFENTVCLSCGRLVGYLPDRRALAGLDPAGEGIWRCPGPPGEQTRYRLCGHAIDFKVCNWMLGEEDTHRYCLSCRLNQIIPNLTEPENLMLWHRIEAAKRRLLYTLDMLRLPIMGRDVDPKNGLAFEFLSDPTSNNEFVDDSGTGARVLTGHRGGVITINIAEAERSTMEKMREDMNERYRTLLGHFRHEAAHYYWDQLIGESSLLTGFRNLFGDERKDYDRALEEHYRTGVTQNWTREWVSVYASVHPWEDWAETWAHYLHMVDTLETAHDFSFSIGGRALNPAVNTQASSGYYPLAFFDELMIDWSALTVALNALNRSMGLEDAYPFIITRKIQSKLQFVHNAIQKR